MTSVTPQVRSLRKGNNDHVAIAVDIDPGSTSRVEDEEEDKGNSALLNQLFVFFKTECSLSYFLVSSLCHSTWI